MLDVAHLTVVLGNTTILDEVNLTIGDGQTLGVLGPSGAGKSTLLRAIAGLVPVTTGSIAWDGTDVAGVPTHLRGFGLMFQGYALFPHLTAAGNVAYGLRMKGLPETEIQARVQEALAAVGLEGFGDRAIVDLSGGEQQRVALARTLAPEPRLVMLDEPLGALDRALREHLLVETREILDNRGVTAIVVTHDHEEATSLSDRLALMNHGTIVQLGTREEILADPADEWVAGFMK
ncbi:MAG: ABC transporter ATP-binding protein [Acidimicrobiia bacterium]